MPASVGWFANLDNPRTRRAYQADLQDFCGFLGISQANDFRQVTQAHVLAWRQQLEHRQLAGSTIRRKLSALVSLLDYRLDSNAVAGGNPPVHGVKRPVIESNEGKTPALDDHQAQTLLDAPDPTILLDHRDRATLAVLLYHGLRRGEATGLLLTNLRILGKRNKVLYLPLHPVAAERIHAYLELAGPLFRATRGPKRTGSLVGLSADSIHDLVGRYCRQAGIDALGLGVHGL